MPDYFAKEVHAINPAVTLTSSRALGLPSITDRLVEVLGEEADGVTSREDLEGMVLAASAAWNLSVMAALGAPPPPEFFDNRHDQVEDLAAMKDFIALLADRKTRLFPEDHRLIQHSRVVEEAHQYRILAAATNLPQDR